MSQIFLQGDSSDGGLKIIIANNGIFYRRKENFVNTNLDNCGENFITEFVELKFPSVCRCGTPCRSLFAYVTDFRKYREPGRYVRGQYYKAHTAANLLFKR
jgi:hypothetical protein